MFRYRCPHCRQILQALEIRAGKTTICSKCSKPLTIPSDRSQWLNERGEPLAAAPTVNLAASASGRASAPVEEQDAGDDVLGAIFVGSDLSPSGLTGKEPLPFIGRPAQPAAAELPPGYPPRTGRIPFPLPDAPRSAAWLIPPSRSQEARLAEPPAKTPPPADRTEQPPEEPPAEAARTEEPPAHSPEPDWSPPREPEAEDTVVAERIEPPPAPPEESHADSDSIFDMERPTREERSEPVEEPVAESPPTAPRPDETLKAPATPLPPRPDETLVAPPRTPPAPPAPAPTPPPARPPEPRKVAAVEPPREVRPSPPRRPSPPPPQPEPPPQEPPRTRPSQRGPRLEPVPVPVPPPRGSGSVSNRRRLIVTTPAPLPRPDAGPAAGYAEPFRAHEQEEVAAHLAAALTTRMKPPPEPPRDLKPSTALWLVATGLALALLLLALVTPGDYLRAAGIIGAIELLVGYVWIVWLTFRREPRRGLLCAIPPLTARYLLEKKYAKYRPLRFVATGLVLLTLAGIGGLAQSRTRGWVGVHEPGPPVPSPADLEKQPKLVQIREYRKQRSIDPLVKVLDALAKTDPTFSEDAKDRADLTAELRSLCADQQTDVRVAALGAYARWGGDEARSVCLKFIGSESADERRAALKLLPRWKDPEVARAVAARIGRPSTETTLAVESLLEIGGPAAEQAAIPLLRTDDQGTRLTAIDILEKVGGADALAVLTELINSDDPIVRQRATAKAQVIKARLQKK
jgi:hypothetical protein